MDDQIFGLDRLDTIHGVDGDDRALIESTAHGLSGGAGNNTFELIAISYSGKRLNQAANAMQADASDLMIVDGFDILFDGDGGGGFTDMIDGGVPCDTAHYFDATTALVVDMAGHQNAAVNSGKQELDTWIGIEGFLRVGVFSNDNTFTADNSGILGGSQGDTIRGGAGPNALLGLAGIDTLQGEEGNDAIVGGAGRDTLIRDAGNDDFIFRNGNGLDIIADWIRLATCSCSSRPD